MSTDVERRKKSDAVDNKKRKKGKKRVKNKRRTLIIVDVVLVVVLASIFGGYFGVKKFVTDNFLHKIYRPAEDYTVDPSKQAEIDKYSEPVDMTEPFTNENGEEYTLSYEDNLEAVENALQANTDAKEFFESGAIFEANYITNILLIGTDVRIRNARNGNSDSMILISINKQTKRIIMTSLMRDMYLYIPAPVNNSHKINYAHSSRGSAFLCQALTGNLKIKIDKYVKVDFYGLIDIIDAVGGIDINVTEKEIKYANSYIYEMWQHCDYSSQYNWEEVIIKSPGMQHLNGMQAVGYARIRAVGDDFQRTKRQRAVLNAIKDKIFKMKPTQIFTFAQTAFENVASNLTDDELWGFVKNALDYVSYEVVEQRIPYNNTYKGAMLPYPDGSSIIVDLPTNVKKMLEVICGRSGSN